MQTNREQALRWIINEEDVLRMHGWMYVSLYMVSDWALMFLCLLVSLAEITDRSGRFGKHDGVTRRPLTVSFGPSCWDYLEEFLNIH